MLITAMGMLQVKLSANLMSLGALDFGLIVDGAVIIAENSLRYLAECQRRLGRALVQHERLDTVMESANEVIRPTVYGQFIIGLVYVPLLTFSGVEGKTFQPMALTVLIALVTAFVLSLTFMPAMIAIFVTGKVNERDNGFVRGLKALYRPVLSAVIRRPMPAIAAGILTFACAVLLFSRLGQEFIPKLDEKNIVMEVKRIPSTSLSQSQTMQFVNERMIEKFPQVAFVFSRGGTPDLAADPMPPSATDTYIILKPRQEWPDLDLPKNDLIRDIADQAAKIPGNKVGFSQPIQMRFNELIAGVREDSAVSVFGDEFEPMLRSANQIAAVLEGVRGTTEVKVEDVAGMPVLEINIDKAEIARHGLSLSAVQDVIGIAVAAGRPVWCSKATAASRSWCGWPTSSAIISKFSKTCRFHCPGLWRMPAKARRPRFHCACRRFQSFRGAEPGQPRERQAARRRYCRRARPRHRLGGRGSADKDRPKSDAAARLLADLGRAV